MVLYKYFTYLNINTVKICCYMYSGLLTFQIDQLVSSGANILAAIAVGSHRQIGTIVDYAYYVYNLVCIVCSMLFSFCVTILQINWPSSCYLAV